MKPFSSLTHAYNIIICILFLSACQVVSLPSNAKDDLYSQYGADLQKEYRIKFIETTAEEMLASDYNHIYLFAEWCAGCYLTYA